MLAQRMQPGMLYWTLWDLTENVLYCVLEPRPFGSQNRNILYATETTNLLKIELYKLTGQMVNKPAGTVGI